MYFKLKSHHVGLPAFQKHKKLLMQTAEYRATYCKMCIGNKNSSSYGNALLSLFDLVRRRIRLCNSYKVIR